ncbi:MAG: hypothetical protein NUW07_01980 [Candidatus Saccharicenans sp.]|nr:hypothetical protein [Candidatus Saccharicenans sp.]MDH7492321.1 hypothetical protein [Candidatus Saccharicenans sp.]
MKDKRFKGLGAIIKEALASMSSYSALRVSEIFDNWLELMGASLQRLLLFSKIFGLAAFLFGIFAAANDAYLALWIQVYEAKEPGNLGVLWALLADATTGLLLGLPVAIVYLALYALAAGIFIGCKGKRAKAFLPSARQ